jgi:tRNA modification GTPase
MSRTIATILTPLGEGGIGVVGLLGPQAIHVANRFFRGTRVKDLAVLPSGRICHGFVHDESGPVDEVIVHVSRGQTPKMDIVEVNCHGGVVPVRKVLALCLHEGAVEAKPDEFMRRSAQREGLDAIQREALLLLPKARTSLAALVLLDQLNGALSNAVRSHVERLEKCLRQKGAALARATKEVARDLDELLAVAPLGMALTRPRRLVVVGKPNVGKSTLVNALLAEERVLVHHLPGTTRDAVATMVEISGVPFELVDTAGVRESSARGGPASGGGHECRSKLRPACLRDLGEPYLERHELEMLGVEQTWREVAEADLILMLLDRSRPLDAEDAHIMAALRNRDVIFVVTKTDLPQGFNPVTLKKAARAPVCMISAKTGVGLDSLCKIILTRVGWAPHKPGRPIPFTERHAQCIRTAAELLRTQNRGNVAGAIANLRKLLP